MERLALFLRVSSVVAAFALAAYGVKSCMQVAFVPKQVYVPTDPDHTTLHNTGHPVGWCNPELVNCGYGQPYCQTIAPSQRAAKGC